MGLVKIKPVLDSRPMSFIGSRDPMPWTLVQGNIQTKECGPSCSCNAISPAKHTVLGFHNPPLAVFDICADLTVGAEDRLGSALWIDLSFRYRSASSRRSRGNRLQKSVRRRRRSLERPRIVPLEKTLTRRTVEHPWHSS